MPRAEKNACRPTEQGTHQVRAPGEGTRLHIIRSLLPLISHYVTSLTTGLGAADHALQSTTRPICNQLNSKHDRHPYPYRHYASTISMLATTKLHRDYVRSRQYHATTSNNSMCACCLLQRSPACVANGKSGFGSAETPAQRTQSTDSTLTTHSLS